MKLGDMWQKVIAFGNENSPAILSGFSVAGVFFTGYLAYKAGPKANKIIENYHKDKELIDPDDKETKRTVVKETVKELVPVLLPPVLMGCATIGCIIGSNKIASRRMAVLSAAYTITDGRLKDYKEKLLSTLGEKKTEQVRDAIAADHLEKADLGTNFIVTGGGDVACIDHYSKQKFESSAETIQKAINKLSARMIEYIKMGDEPFIELGELYEELGIEQTPYSRDFGWTEDDMVNGLLPIYFTATLRDNKPYLVVEYDDLSPRKEYIYRHMDR